MENDSAHALLRVIELQQMSVDSTFQYLIKLFSNFFNVFKGISYIIIPTPRLLMACFYF